MEGSDSDANIIAATLFTTSYTIYLASVIVAAVLGCLFLSSLRWKPVAKVPRVVEWKAEAAASETVETTDHPFSFDSSTPLSPPQVPFVVLHDPKWKDIGRALETYEEEVAALMNGLSRSLEVAQESEWDLFDDEEIEYLLSKQLQRRIDRMAVLLDENTRLLQEELLKPFPVIKLLPNEYYEENHVHWTIKRSPFGKQPPHRVTKETLEFPAYDCASQVMAHITRDWTRLGRLVRQRTYDWCRDQLASRLAIGDSILVPGAGLGRLAYDLACDGYSVEANEISLLMASAAYAILQRKVQGTLHPFLMDFFTNEVDSEWRYEGIPFPDETIGDMSGSLSFTVGDFVEAYSKISHRHHDGIVTCFFLDTATNIYEYLWTIYNVLRQGGVWVHVGPLQWHRNARLHPSANELKGLVESFGFEIVHWSVDKHPIDYRYEDLTTTRSTKYEAFKPLRMVAIREGTTKSSLFPQFLHKSHKPKIETVPVSHNPSTVVIEEL